MNRFKGKTVIVTGAAQGIGAGIAERFAQEGANLVLCDINLEALETFAATLRRDGQVLFCSRIDVSCEEEVNALIALALEKLGRLDVVVNNAGIGVSGHVTEVNSTDWHRVMGVTLDSVFYAARAAIPQLVKTRGSIVNICSISGLYGDYGLATYNTAKGAVANLTRNMAIDHAPEGVRVNAVCPGGVRTPAAKMLAEHPYFQEEYAKLIPMGRMADPQEVAGAVAFLASDDASYITGINLVVDGGVTAATGQPNFRRLQQRLAAEAGNR